MKRLVIYVHGKGGNAAEAGHYRSIFSDCDVKGGEHWFHTDEQMAFLDNWIKG